MFARRCQRDARELKTGLTACHERANHFAHSRTSDERKAADLAGLLQHWMIHGRPRKEPRQAELGEPTEE